MRSDENLWIEKHQSNEQNERYWSNHDPNVEIDCKQQGGRGIMCWAGLNNGEVILHLFNVGTSINQNVYLEMLQTDMWPRISRVSNRKRYWFQQDGAASHTALRVREWLTSKFRERVISRFIGRPCPAKISDIFHVDY